MVGYCEIKAIGTTAERYQYSTDIEVASEQVQGFLTFRAWCSAVKADVGKLDLFQRRSDKVESCCPEGEDDTTYLLV